ncbi:MAG: ABC transporter ATP-binding protein [Deltaproteobacteria bacterium]|nr:ABC transporter ATP-binding protein [Deltaproteobacteria bacterium]
MIEVRHLKKSYSGHGVVVEDLSLQIQEGECLVLVGTSGCGKSTLLKMVNGLIRPDEGTVLIRKEPLPYDNLIPVRRQIGYVIQQGGLFPHLTVFQNISLLARLEKWSEGKIQERVRQLLELVGLASGRYESKFPSELSGGEQQRVGVARALMLNPPIVLMDEPFGALDPITRRGIQNDFLKLQGRLTGRKTIVFVTHDMEEAVLMANRIVVMDRGQIVQIGTAGEIQKNPKTDFVADFFSK